MINALALRRSWECDKYLKGVCLHFYDRASKFSFVYMKINGKKGPESLADTPRILKTCVSIRSSTGYSNGDRKIDELRKKIIHPWKFGTKETFEFWESSVWRKC